MSARDEQVAQAIAFETSRFLARGGLYAAVMGAVAVVTVGGLWLGTGDGFYALPTAFALLGALSSLLLSEAARRAWLKGLTRNVVVLGLVSLPTGLFAAAHVLEPAGAATFITGPFINLYSFLLVITGFLLSFRLSALAGLVVALEYLFVFSLARCCSRPRQSLRFSTTCRRGPSPSTARSCSSSPVSRSVALRCWCDASSSASSTWGSRPRW